jgi:NADPH:quinone reductase-like Zn-dependent oxidoreductase
VGIHCIQLVRHLGAHCIAVTTSPLHRQRLLDLGAAEVLVTERSKPAFHKQLDQQVDVVLELVGVPTMNA